MATVAAVALAIVATEPTGVLLSRTASLRRPASSSVLGAPGAMVTVYGAAGTFGALGTTPVPAAQIPVGQPVPGWGLLPGQAISIAVGVSGGAVIMGNEPQTGNQAFASAATMAVSVFDPTTNRFQNVVIPTSAGATSVLEPGDQVGGSDVVGLVPQGGQVAFLAEWPYRGWDVDKYGQYPTFGQVGKTSGVWHYIAGSGKTGAAIRSSGGPALGGANGACVLQPSGYAAPIAGCRAPSSIGALPASHDLAVTQYGVDVANGRNSGGLMILGPNGSLVASYAYPNVSVGGSPVFVLPREIDVDPIATNGIERFAVVFDAFDARGVGSPFTLQEFTFQAATGTLKPVSMPFLPGQSVRGLQSYVETAHFDHTGNLWIAESVMGDSLAGGNIIEYSAASVAGRLASGQCAAGPTWTTSQWGATCSPDFTITDSDGQGMVKSLAEDTATGSMLFATLTGALLPVVATTDPQKPWVEKPYVDLGLNELVDRNYVSVSPRQGFVDPATRSMWIPIEQTEDIATCAPVWFACQQPPSRTNQWLYRVDLRQLLG